MAELTLTTNKSVLATPTPPSSARLSFEEAGEDLLAGAPCYLKSDGKVYMATAAAANAAAQVHGWTVASAKSGYPVSIYRGVTIDYAAEGTLTPGSDIFLSATVAGGLQTAAQANQTTPIGFAVDDTKIFIKTTK